MSHGTPHDLADGHVLLDTDTYENALDMLLSPGDDLGLSPFPDIAHDLQFQANASLCLNPGGWVFRGRKGFVRGVRRHGLWRADRWYGRR